MVEGKGRRLEVPTAFADDDGSADPALAEVMRACARGERSVADVVAVFATGPRLLVPIVAVLDELGDDGEEKSSHMASVTLVQSDGRRGMLAFTSLDALKAWNADARPVAARAPEVAQAAIEEQCQGLLIDIAGPVRFALDGEFLRQVAGLS